VVAVRTVSPTASTTATVGGQCRCQLGHRCQYRRGCRDQQWRRCDAGDAGFSRTVRFCCFLHPLSSIVLLCVFGTADTVLEEVVVCKLQPSTDWARLCFSCARVSLVYSGDFGQRRADGRRASGWAAGEREVGGRAGDRSARKHQEALQDELVRTDARGEGGKGGEASERAPGSRWGGGVRALPGSPRERAINHQSPCKCNRSRKRHLHGRVAAE